MVYRLIYDLQQKAIFWGLSKAVHLSYSPVMQSPSVFVDTLGNLFLHFLLKKYEEHAIS